MITLKLLTKMKPVNLTLLILLLMIVPHITNGQDSYGAGNKVFQYKNSFRSRTVGVGYTEIGGGAAIWHQSQQVKMKNKQMPFHVLIACGNTAKPLAFGISYNFNASYELDSFQLKSEYLSLEAKYIFTRMIPGFPSNMEMYGMGAVIGWRASFTDNRTAPSNDVRIPQKAQNVGYALSAGIRYRIRAIGIAAEFTQYNGSTNFNIGDLGKSKAFIGSNQLKLLVTYRLSMARGKVLCPVYKK